MPSNFTEFKSIVIKSYQINDDNTQNHSLSTAEILLFTQNLLSDTLLLPATKTPSTPITRLFQVQQPPIKYQNMANIFIFL